MHTIKVESQALPGGSNLNGALNLQKMLLDQHLFLTDYSIYWLLALKVISNVGPFKMWSREGDLDMVLNYSIFT